MSQVKRLVLLCAALVGVAACASQDAAVSILPASGNNFAALGHDQWFPIGVPVPDEARTDSFVRSWYGKQLAAFSEPRMGSFVDSSNVDAVRFLWLRTFDHPIVVRAIRRGSAYALIGIELGGAGGYEPGRVVRRDSVAIDAVTWARLTNGLSDSTFWADAPRSMGLDGAQWIVEGVSPGKLYIVSRWSPADTLPSSGVRAFGLLMLEAAHLTPNRIY